MTNGVVTPCDYARERHRNIAMWRHLWTILLFVFGTSVVVFLCLAVLFLLRQDWLPGAVTTLGTIVNGVSIKWIVDRRTEAVEEEERAYQDVKQNCKDATAADNLRAKLRPF